MDKKEIRGLPEGVLSESATSSQGEFQNDKNSEIRIGTNLIRQGTGIQNPKRHLESSLHLATVEVSSM